MSDLSSASLPDVSIVIPTYNGKRFLETCLESVYQMNGCRFEVIIVDNGSKDGTKEFLKEHYPQVKGIFLPTNAGFAKAVNEGIKASVGKYIALLNNDTEVDSNWLTILKERLDQNAFIGFCASKMLNFHIRNVLDGAGDIYFRNGNAYRLGWGLRDAPVFNQSFRVFGACAGAAMYRRSMIDDIGGLDEDFFLYYEDVDFNFRAQLYGYQCEYVPEAVVYHIGSATTGSVINKTTMYYSTRNWLYVVLKNYPTSCLIKNFRRIILGRLYHQLGFLRCSMSLFFVCLAAHLSAFGKILPMLKKRKIIQKNRKVSDVYIETLLMQGEELMKVHKTIQNQ